MLYIYIHKIAILMYSYSVPVRFGESTGARVGRPAFFLCRKYGRRHCRYCRYLSSPRMNETCFSIRSDDVRCVDWLLGIITSAKPNLCRKVWVRIFASFLVGFLQIASREDRRASSIAMILLSAPPNSQCSMIRYHMVPPLVLSLPLMSWPGSGDAASSGKSAVKALKAAGYLVRTPVEHVRTGKAGNGSDHGPRGMVHGTWKPWSNKS